MKAKLLYFASVATRGHYSNTIIQKQKRVWLKRVNLPHIKIYFDAVDLKKKQKQKNQHTSVYPDYLS